MSNILYKPEEVRQTILYLDYIGGVTEHKKLFFKECVYVGNTDYYLRYKRYMEGENIDSQIDFMKKLFNNYIRLKSGYDGVFNIELNQSFIRFHVGLNLLCSTYQNDKLNRFYEYITDYRKMKISQGR